MIKINLFPLKEIRKQNALKKIIIVNVILFLIIGIGIISVYMNNLEKIKKLDTSIKIERQKLLKLTSLRRKIGDFKKKKKILETKLKIINNLNALRLYPSYIFYLISKNIPEEIWLTYMSVDYKKISIRGIAMDEPTIVKFIKKLRETKFFTNIYIDQINQREIQKIPLKEFTMDLYPDVTKFKGIL